MFCLGAVLLGVLLYYLTRQLGLGRRPPPALPGPPAGRVGCGLDLFNLVRFAGLTIGAVWMGITLTRAQRYGLLFLGCLVMAALGFAGSYAGRNPAPAPAT